MTNETEEQGMVAADGEVESSPLALLDAGLAIGLTRAEIDQQIATARRYPRSVKRAVDNIMSLATYDEEAAGECMYSLPRAGKALEGPSTRFAEVVAQSWCNNRVAARVVTIDRENKFVEAEGVYHDLETNAAIKATVRRRIVDKRGRLFTDDMIIVTGNAACSIARRNAVLAGVPKAAWRIGYDGARKVIMGDAQTLANRRERAVAAFTRFGVTAEQVFLALEVKGLEDITIEHLPRLFGMFSSLKNGEETVETLFDPRRGGQAFEKVADPLADSQTGEIKEARAAPERTAAKEVAKPATAPLPAEPEAPPAEDAIAAAKERGIAARKAGKAFRVPDDLGSEAAKKAFSTGWSEEDDREAAEESLS